MYKRQILKTDGTPLLDGDGQPVVIQNNTFLPAGLEGNALDLTMYGKGKLNYGKDWNENFVRILENFADDTAPNFPQDGMIWFDKSGSPPENKLRHYANGSWSAIATESYVSSEIGALLGSPSGLGPLPWSGGAAPSGWLLCDGTSYPTATYPELFAAIGYTYGGGGASFNVPDMRGRFPLGLHDGTAGTVNRVGPTEYPAVNSPGVAGGDDVVTLGSTQVPNHTHTATGSSNTVGNHTHTGTAASAGSHTHTIEYGTNDVNGGGGTYPTYMTRTGSFETTSSNGAHTHSLSINGAGSHSHTITVTVNATTGGGQPHRNVPPYLAFNYIIKT